MDTYYEKMDFSKENFSNIVVRMRKIIIDWNQRLPEDGMQATDITKMKKYIETKFINLVSILRKAELLVNI